MKSDETQIPVLRKASVDHPEVAELAMHFHAASLDQARLHDEQHQPRHEQQCMKVHGRVRNAAGDGRRMPGDQAEEVCPREANQSGEQHHDGYGGVELAVARRGGDERTGRSSGSHGGQRY